MAVANKTLTSEEQGIGAAVQTEPTAITPVLGQTTTAIEPEIQTLPGKTIVPQTEIVQSGVVRPTELSLGAPNYYETMAPLVSTWESNAEKQAGAQFQKDVLAAKQSLVQNREQMQQQGEQAQTQLALGDYMRSQSAEKAGWTGGYMLDQKRQGDYLRASIQAQMYGAQELQRYGMETQLEAARLAFDLGKEQLAYQLYQQEQQKAITEAQMFGYYVSPEIKYLINQLRTAQSVLVDDTASTNEKARAQSVVDQIDLWFGEEGIDPNDVTTFSEITMEREQWNQAKLDAILATINDDPSVFLARNTNGTYATDPATGQYMKLNFEDITKDDLFSFLGKDNNAEYKFADTAFKSYAKYLGQSTINSYFTSLDEGEVPTSEGFQEYLNGEGNDRIAAYLEGLGLEKGSTEYNQVQELLTENFNPTLTRDGVSISYTFGERATPTRTPTTPEEAIINENNPDAIYTNFKNPYTNTVITRDEFIERYRKYAYANKVGASADLPTSATGYAEQYKVFYDNAMANYSFSKQLPESINYIDWAKNLHNSHNMFVGESYDAHIEERIGSYFKEKAGFDFGEINFEDTPSGPIASTIKIDAFNLNNVQKQKLIELGFNSRVVNGKEMLYIGFTKPESIKPLPGSQKVTDWNGTYGSWNNSRQDKEYWLFTLLKVPASDLTNTTEGEGRF